MSHPILVAFIVEPTPGIKAINPPAISCALDGFVLVDVETVEDIVEIAGVDTVNGVDVVLIVVDIGKFVGILAVVVSAGEFDVDISGTFVMFIDTSGGVF